MTIPIVPQCSRSSAPSFVANLPRRNSTRVSAPRQHLIVGLKVGSAFLISGTIDRFDTGDAFYEPGFVPVNMLDQFGLCIRRACDEDRLGVRQRRSTRCENRPDPRPRCPIRCSSPCMEMGCWIGGMRDRLVRAVPVKIKKRMLRDDRSTRRRGYGWSSCVSPAFWRKSVQ